MRNLPNHLQVYSPSYNEFLDAIAYEARLLGIRGIIKAYGGIGSDIWMEYYARRRTITPARIVGILMEQSKALEGAMNGEAEDADEEAA